jgi:multicomponent Na+:H+ antiporter subunit E
MSIILRPFYALRLFILFLWDLVASSVQVARVVLSPRDLARPRFTVLPLRASSDIEITLVANFISLTPGTITIDVSPDRKTLLVHDMFAGESSEGARIATRDGIEQRVLKVTRS